ncbi:putative chlorohydrolase family protein [Aspergillus fischeri NRRL 181]|uniref:Amidohydrolase family protein n=1 Tax=Neosartorya fischeri (strain ATCC 1020 / DSM 3700 / CBS 544.65 / FGSC A1164 / JCM 1740 / NRRL 181 / WB 181) TaxID=331117 RepID=A1CVC0_NEOFI|nr:amidohydrolase family protein [Aspergillus fischeri NRRL 181]EAW25697.1 amidohydrolase family protein [Aspergillus fischeri NRRL 181]
MSNKLLLCLQLFLYASTCLAEASILFQDAAAVISFNRTSETLRVIYNASVLVTGKTIAAIDTHRHAWQTAFKTLGSNTSLAEYFVRYGEFSPAKKIFTPEDVYIGQLTGLYESLNSGVTSILDHAHHTWSSETALAGLQASVDSGARTWWCYAFHNLSDATWVSNYTREDQMADFLHIAKDGPWRKSDTVSLRIAYDNFAMEDVAEIEQIISLALSQNVSAFTMHYLGGPWSYANSPQLVDQYNFLNTPIPIVFSHASYLTVKDAELLRSANQYISITGESERHYGHGHPRSQYIMDQSSLGIDTHFTYSADIVGQARMWLQEVRLRLYAQVLDHWDIPPNNPMSVEQAFLLATRAGGLALRRPDIGVLVKGAKADLVVFDGTSPNMLGWDDPVTAVILHSNPGDVEHVLVIGELRKRDFKLVVPGNLALIQQRFLASARRIKEVWKQMPPPVLEGSFPYTPGVNYSEAVTADVVRGWENGYLSS